MAFLPEGFDSIEESKELAMEAAQSVDGDVISKYCEVAKSQQMWLSLGGFKEKVYIATCMNFNYASIE